MYYMVETTAPAAKTRKAEPLKAQNLTSAKREASRKSCICNSHLFIGYSVDANGFIENICAEKENGTWKNWEIEV